jgi:translocation and assembly module TamA
MCARTPGRYALSRRRLFTLAPAWAFLMAMWHTGEAPAAPAPPLPDSSFDTALPPLEATEPPPAAPAARQSLPPPEPAPPDSALAAPLVPLGQFDATPPPATAAQTATDAADTNLRIRYTSEIRGLEGLSGEPPEGSLDHRFRALSALMKEGGKAANAAQIQARANEDVALAERLLRAAGYYDGIATATLDPVAGQPGAVHVTVTATPGQRYMLGEIVVTAAPEPAGIARHALGLEPGMPVDAALIEGSEANASLRLPEQGYPFATLGQRDVALDEASHRGDYTLPVAAGPKSRFGRIRTAGDKVFSAKHLAIFPRYRAGEIYDSRKVEDLRQALVNTSMFSTVAVRPVRIGEAEADGTEVVDLEVTQAKGPWHSLSAAAGYATGEGAKVTGSYTWRNLFPPEGALILTAVAGTQEQGGSVTFRRANAGQRDRTFQAMLAVDRTDYAAYQARTADLSVSLSRVSTPIFQKRWTWSIGAEIVGTNEQGAALVAGDPRPRRSYLIGALPLLLGYDRSNDLLNPTKGVRVTARLSPETSLQGGRVKPYVRTQLQATGYFPVSGSIVLAGRALVGSIIGTDTATLAPSRRLYAGGGGSVRGYGYQQLGPKDANADPIGGRDQVEFALEARFRFGNFGVVPFIDAGRAGDSSLPSLTDMRYGAGIGARYYTNFGPLRLDLATPLNRQPGDSRIAVYIGIGQAF